MSDDKDANDKLTELSNVVGIEEARKQIGEKLKKNRKEIDYETSTNAETDAIQDHKINEMNAKHQFIHNVGDKPKVTDYVYSEVTKRKQMRLVSPDAIIVRYANDPIQKGEKSVVGMGKYWLEHPRRKSFSTVIFDPSKPKETEDGELNAWEGFVTKPIKGSWRHTLKHIYTILCNRDREKFEYVVKWIAWTIQNPHNRAEVALIFKGRQGAGKGFIFTQLVTMFGIHGMSLANRELLTGKHNGHLAHICFLFADEAYYPGDKEVEGVIKNLISEPFVLHRKMYQDAVMGANRLHIGMATNNDWVIPAASDSRRYFINEVDNKYATGQAPHDMRDKYFSRLWLEMKHNGREAMMYDLSNMKLNGWHPRRNIPETVELQRQKHLSLSHLHKAIFQMLQDGDFPGTFSKDEYIVLPDQIYNYLDTLDPSISKLSQNKKSEALKSIGARNDRNAKGKFWVFPELKVCRSNWNVVYTRQNWNYDETWHIVKNEY